MFFYIWAFRGAYECTWKYRSISSNSPVQQEIKDRVNVVKYGCLWLLVEGFIKVMNGLGVTREEDEICRCLYRSAKLSIKSYFVRSSFLSQCIQQQWSVGQNYLHSELTADCSLLVSGRKERKLWSQPALACFMSKSVPQTPQPNRLQFSSPVEALNLNVDSKSYPFELDNSTIGSYMCRRGERKACNHIVLWFDMTFDVMLRDDSSFGKLTNMSDFHFYW